MFSFCRFTFIFILLSCGPSIVDNINPDSEKAESISSNSGRLGHIYDKLIENEFFYEKIMPKESKILMCLSKLSQFDSF